MLTPDQISTLGEAARKITAPVSEYLLQDITRRVAEAGQLTSTAQYQVWRAQQLGVSQRELKKELRRRLGLSHQEIRRVLYQSAQSGYDLDIRRFPYVQALPFARNASLQQIVAAAVELAQADFTNLVQTLGMVDPFGKALPLQDAYRSCTDFAFQQVITGAASYTQAIRQATRNLAEKDVRTIDYQSGVHTSLEAAVRRNILGGLGLMLEQVSQVTHDQLGCNGWEISAHANSAPDHEPIQGRQYPDREYEALNNSLRRRIGTLNCGHTAFPIILGVNRPQHSKAELEQFRADNEKGVDIDGQHYTGYEATQMQRKLERTIRAQKQRVMVDEAAGDKEKLSQDQSKLTLLHQRYAQFSKAAGLKTQYERTEVAGFGKSSSKSKLTFPAETGKIEINTDSPKRRKPLTVEQVKQTMTAQVQALPEEQRQVLQRYSGFLATQVNMAIRQGKITPELQKEIDLLDAALKDGVMPETVVLHRDTALSYLGLGLPNKPTAEELLRIVGRPVTNDIFTSTSFDNLGLLGRNTEIWLTVPAGYKGCQYIKPVALPKYQYQEEILFARGLKYRITDAKIENGKYILFAEVIK